MMASCRPHVVLVSFSCLHHDLRVFYNENIIDCRCASDRGTSFRQSTDLSVMKNKNVNISSRQSFARRPAKDCRLEMFTFSFFITMRSVDCRKDVPLSDAQ